MDVDTRGRHQTPVDDVFEEITAQLEAQNGKLLDTREKLSDANTRLELLDGRRPHTAITSLASVSANPAAIVGSVNNAPTSASVAMIRTTRTGNLTGHVQRILVREGARGMKSPTHKAASEGQPMQVNEKPRLRSLLT